MRQAHSTDENQNNYFGNQKVDASTQTENSDLAEQSDGEAEEKGSKMEIVEAYLKSNEWSIWYNIIG